jgi:hypothetical protein
MAKHSSGSNAVHSVAQVAQRGASSGRHRQSGPSINAKVARQVAKNKHAGASTGRHRAGNPNTGNRPQVQQQINARIRANAGQGAKHRAPKAPKPPAEPPIAPVAGRSGGLMSNGSNTVKLEFLAGLILIVLSPMANPAIKPDRDYVKRIISWMLVFMLLFPLSSSSQAGLVRLANATGAVLLLVISLKGTKSGFGVDVPTLLNTIIQKIQPGGGANDIPIPPPGVTRPIPGTNSTITGPMNGQDWIIGTSSDF